jgi:hypothetical protein
MRIVALQCVLLRCNAYCLRVFLRTGRHDENTSQQLTKKLTVEFRSYIAFKYMILVLNMTFFTQNYVGFSKS